MAKKKMMIPKEVRNPNAKRNYLLEDSVEAGLHLLGSEVKSIRAGKVQIVSAFVKFNRGGRPFLYGAHISVFSQGNPHDPERPRALLLKKSQILKLKQNLEAKGKMIIPLRIYFKKALIKIEIALATPKKKFDKRQDLKKQSQKREMDRAIKAINF